MGTKLEELRDGAFARAKDDEPMFPLLARDPSAAGLVRTWAIQRKADIDAGRKPASDMEQVNEALRTAEEMVEWRDKHDGDWRGGLFGEANSAHYEFIKSLIENAKHGGADGSIEIEINVYNEAKRLGIDVNDIRTYIAEGGRHGNGTTQEFRTHGDNSAVDD